MRSRNCSSAAAPAGAAVELAREVEAAPLAARSSADAARTQRLDILTAQAGWAEWPAALLGDLGDPGSTERRRGRSCGNDE